MNEKKLKLAVCLYGQPRFIMECYKLSYEKLINTYKPHFYIHTWWDESYIDKPFDISKHAEGAIINNDLLFNKDTPDLIKNIYNPIKCVIDHPNLLGDVTRNYYQYFTQYRVSQLIDQEYDIILRSRFDMKILQNLPLDIYTDKLKLPSCCPNPSVYPDTVSISNQKNYNLISNTYLNLKEFESYGKGYMEYAFTEQIKKENIPIDRFPANYDTFDVFRSHDKILLKNL